MQRGLLRRAQRGWGGALALAAHAAAAAPGREPVLLVGAGLEVVVGALEGEDGAGVGGAAGGGVGVHVGGGGGEGGRHGFCLDDWWFGRLVWRMVGGWFGFGGWYFSVDV